MLDVMHIKRSIMDNILRTILGNKDTAIVRKDMRELAIQPGLWLHERDDILEGTKLKPHASYVLDCVSRLKFLSGIGKLNVPSGYLGSFWKHVVKGRIQILSHTTCTLCRNKFFQLQCNMFNTPQVATRARIIRLSVVFQKICAKVDVLGKIRWLKEYTAETLCILEAWFHPSFNVGI